MATTTKFLVWDAEAVSVELAYLRELSRLHVFQEGDPPEVISLKDISQYRVDSTLLLQTVDLVKDPAAARPTMFPLVHQLLGYFDAPEHVFETLKARAASLDRTPFMEFRMGGHAHTFHLEETYETDIRVREHNLEVCAVF